MLNVNLNQISIAGQLPPDQTFTLSGAELDVLFKSIIRVAGRMPLPATLHLGIGHFSEIGMLATPMARYPAPIVLYGVPDAPLSAAHIKPAEVSDEAPLSQERFLMIYSTYWQVLVAAAPDLGVFRCSLTHDSSTLRQTAELLSAAQEGITATNSGDTLTAQLLWTIAAAFPDISSITRAVGDLGTPLAAASALCQRADWQAALDGIGQWLSATSFGLFRLDSAANALVPVITLKPQRTCSLGHDTTITRAALTRAMVIGEEAGNAVAAFPLVEGDTVWGAIEIRRETAWDELTLAHIHLIAELFGLALKEQTLKPVASGTTPPPPTSPAPHNIVLWPELDSDPATFDEEDSPPASWEMLQTDTFPAAPGDPVGWPLTEQFADLFLQENRSNSFEEVLDVFSILEPLHQTGSNGVSHDEDLLTTWPSLENSDLPAVPWPDLNLARETTWPDFSIFGGQVVDTRSTQETPAIAEDDIEPGESWPPLEEAWVDDYHELEQSIRANVEARRSAEAASRALLEAQFATDEQVIANLQKHIAEQQTARAEFEQFLSDEQSTRAQLERIMEQEHQLSLEIESQINAEQNRRQALANLLADTEYQRIKLERQIADEEERRLQLEAQLQLQQAARAELERLSAQIEPELAEVQAAHAQARQLTEQLERALAVEQNARIELELELAREQGLSAQIEAQLNAEQATRGEMETQLASEPNLRVQVEQSLAEQRRVRAALEAQLAEERAARHAAEVALESERTARVEAEYALIAEVAANDGLQAGSFLRDVRLFVTRMRERVTRLNQTDSALPAAQVRLLDQVVAESNTVIEILSEIALIAQIDVRKHIVPDVGGLLQEVLASLYQQAAQRHVMLQLGPVEPNIRVDGDPEALLRALYNVVLSSVYMAVPQSSVSIALARQDTAAHVRVIFRSTPELTNKLEAFMQHFDQGVPRRSALALARTIVMHHRGALVGRVIDNEATTEISVALPLNR